MNLLVSHPDIAKQWHPTKNNEMKPEQFTSGSGKKMWWLCNKTNCNECCKHEYESIIGNRTKGVGCPYCSKNKICIHNSILYTYPELVKQWHPTKNGDLKPEEFSSNSHFKVWWLCPNKCNEGCKHEWEGVISGRTKGNGCSYCCIPKQKICIHESIVYTHNELVKQWHTNKNGILKPENFSSGSNKKIWWLCEKTCSEGCKHEWETTISSRISGKGCPYCNNHSSRNICIHDSLVYSHPEIAKQWHPNKNKDRKPDIYSFGSNIKVWWICDKYNCSEKCIHEWEDKISNRIIGYGCPYCSKKLICIHNSILYRYPDIAKQWHPTKNNDFTPNKISISNGNKIWWLCPNTCKEGCRHEWETTTASRTSGNNCPYCCNQKICIHESIIYTYPELVKQWHPTKNGDLKPEEFSSHSHFKVWWLCPNTCKEGCMHEWETVISSRTRGNGCPYCSINKLKVCIHESIVYSHPELVKQWHRTKNGEFMPENYGSGSIQKIWWICKTNNIHEWYTIIRLRTQRNTGCPYCVNKTEQKLYDILIIHYLELKTQFKVEWCKNKTYLPFDFILENDKIIIELDGLQHFEQVSNWAPPEETHINDKYKMKCANANCFSVIRLLQTDVFYDTYNWLEELKTNIEKIKTDKIIQNIYMCKDNEYDIFNNLETSLD